MDFSSKPQKMTRKILRVAKKDSAFVYFILESYEGITAYSTLPHQIGEAHRDLELRIPLDFVKEVDELIQHLGGLVYEVSTSTR